MAVDQGFEVELYAGGRVISFEMTLEFLRSSHHPGIQALMQRESRDDHWRAALTIVEPIFDGSAEDEIRVIDREGALWIIKPAAVQMVRVVDPLDNRRQPAGFHIHARQSAVAPASQRDHA